MSRAFTKERDDAPEPARFVPRRYADDVPAPPDDHSVVGMGARVGVRGIAKAPSTFTIVAPDQTDVKAGRIAIDSPLASALLGHRKGDRVVWHRPAGDLEIVVADIAYDA